MNTVEILAGLNYGLVLLYGVFLSTAIAGGWSNRRQRFFIVVLCPLLFLAVQLLCWLLLGAARTRQIYPFIAHLPLVLALVFGLKKPVGLAVISVCIAYLCCLLPNCAAVLVAILTGSGVVGLTVYITIMFPVFYLLMRYFVPSARAAMTESPKALYLFGSLPALFYVYDYVIAARFSGLHSDLMVTHFLYTDGELTAAVLPTIVCLLYMVYTTAYRHQLQERSQSELEHSLLTTQLKQAEGELATLRRTESQTAIYRHDMRHHLSAINAFLSDGRLEQAQEYIQEVQADMEAITPRRFCENELVNLLCSSYEAKARGAGVRLSVKAELPPSLRIPDTKLCALLANGLENAIHAADALAEKDRWVNCVCRLRAGSLLLEIKNPCAGVVRIRDKLPVSEKEGHGYGCRSIQAITQSCGGLCQFEAEDGIFTLRVMLPSA